VTTLPLRVQIDLCDARIDLGLQRVQVDAVRLRQCEDAALRPLLDLDQLLDLTAEDRELRRRPGAGRIVLQIGEEELDEVAADFRFGDSGLIGPALAESGKDDLLLD